MHLRSFKDWVQPLSNKLYATALRLVVNREDARDIVQDVILKLWKKRLELEKMENPDGYAMRMVSNKSLDWLKKHKPIYADLNDSFFETRRSESFEETFHNREKINTIHHLVQQMKPEHKLLFELREIQGKSYQEMADYLEIDINKVKVNLHRIRKRLKEHCEALEKYGVAKN